MRIALTAAEMAVLGAQLDKPTQILIGERENLNQLLDEGIRSLIARGFLQRPEDQWVLDPGFEKLGRLILGADRLASHTIFTEGAAGVSQFLVTEDFVITVVPLFTDVAVYEANSLDGILERILATPESPTVNTVTVAAAGAQQSIAWRAGDEDTVEIDLGDGVESTDRQQLENRVRALFGLESAIAT